MQLFYLFWISQYNRSCFKLSCLLAYVCINQNLIYSVTNYLWCIIPSGILRRRLWSWVQVFNSCCETDDCRASMKLLWTCKVLLISKVPPTLPLTRLKAWKLRLVQKLLVPAMLMKLKASFPAVNISSWWLSVLVMATKCM